MKKIVIVALLFLSQCYIKSMHEDTLEIVNTHLMIKEFSKKFSGHPYLVVHAFLHRLFDTEGESSQEIKNFCINAGVLKKGEYNFTQPAENLLKHINILTNDGNFKNPKIIFKILKNKELQEDILNCRAQKSEFELQLDDAKLYNNDIPQRRFDILDRLLGPEYR